MNTLKTEETITRQSSGTKRVVDFEKLLPETDKYTDRFKEAFINKVRNDVTRYIIEQYFEGLESGAEPESIASLFNENVDFYVPGHTVLFPWTGRRKGRAGVADFINDLHSKVDSIVLDVRSMLVDGAEAVVLGGMESRVKNTGKILETEFVIAFTVHNALITRFRLFEDHCSFALSAQVAKDKEQKQELVSSHY